MYICRFLLAVATYIAVGSGINLGLGKRSATDVFPNYAFWIGFPYLLLVRRHALFLLDVIFRQFTYHVVFILTHKHPNTENSRICISVNAYCDISVSYHLLSAYCIRIAWWGQSSWSPSSLIFTGHLLPAPQCLILYFFSFTGRSTLLFQSNYLLQLLQNCSASEWSEEVQGPIWDTAGVAAEATGDRTFTLGLCSRLLLLICL